MLMQQKRVSGIDGISYLFTLTPVYLEVDYGGGYYQVVFLSSGLGALCLPSPVCLSVGLSVKDVKKMSKNVKREV